MGTHVTEESWFGRIGGAIKGIFFGGLLTVVSVPLLFWNEGRAVHTAKGLKEGASVVVDIQPENVDSANEGKFVHTTGETTTSDVLKDDEFNVSFNGIRLTRNVEMYQWKENRETSREKKLGGGTRKITEYTYEKGWYPGLIDSKNFDEPQHKNPTQSPFSTREQQADNVQLGKFRLPDSLIDKISDEEYIELKESNIPVGYEGRATIVREGNDEVSQMYLSQTAVTSKEKSQPANEASDSKTSEEAVSAEDQEVLDLIAPHVEEKSAAASEGNSSNQAENTADLSDLESPAAAPQIGDVRVWFTATPVSTVSLLSQQKADSFTPFQTSYGTEIHTLQMGAASAAEMIAHEESVNRALTWALRIGGTFIMFLGLVMILRPLVVVADVLPFLGSLVGFGTALVAGLLTIAGSMTVIGFAWVFYRPVLGVSLLIVAAVAIYLVVSRAKKGRTGGPETLTASDLA
ncbi:TMEM43 family protein [Stieleria sp. JC731]|uniref:TMEM43 family protein n=1 Tax=Pirellulaceae TaxID=2691357 RepID=UPI001E4DA527|nr:TMEM43 family protein [Stieleria sp. JC731]MCC9603901.1 TMEM43 family protein [Stieleria sp. JC731]